MRCSSCEPLLDRYVEGTLEPRRMAAISAHLRDCSACANLLTELRVIDALLATTREAELAPNFTFAVMAETRTIARVAPRRVRLWLIGALYLTLAWVLLGVAALAGGGRIAWAAALWGAARAQSADAFAALSGAAHGLGSSAPITIGIVVAVLAIDIVLALGAIYFHRTLRPRLAAQLSPREVA